MSVTGLDWTGPSSSGSQCPLVWFSNWTWAANLCPPQFQFYSPLGPDGHKPSIYARIRQSLSMASPQMNHITISWSSAWSLSGPTLTPDKCEGDEGLSKLFGSDTIIDNNCINYRVHSCQYVIVAEPDHVAIYEWIQNHRQRVRKLQ